MPPLILTTFILALLVGIHSLKNAGIYQWVISWLLQPSNKNSEETLSEGKRLFLLLPVYHEQGVISESLIFLSKLIKNQPNTFLIVIPTKKEDAPGSIDPTTEDLACAVIKKIGNKNIQVWKYPHKEGFMAHQLNFAAEKISKDYPDGENWLFVLNIDSIYTKPALHAIFKKINQGGERVYQFSALFLKNFSSFHGTSKYFLQAMAIFQSRWTLTHEIRRYLVNSKNNFFSRYQFAHAVGHGLLMPVKMFERFKLPEDMPIEDSPFGFILRAHGIPIEPMKILEIGDSPNSISEVYKQKYMWSFGPLWYIPYFLSFRKKYPTIFSKNRFKILILTSQGVLSAIGWLFSSWILLWLIISIAFVPFLLKLLIIVCLVLYSFDYVLALLFFIKHKYIKLSFFDSIALYLNLWAIILTHSFPADYALWHSLIRGFNNADIKKIKSSHSV